ncbi:hypothetical protein HDU96_002671 [Phlyctochytrium bullatum]|nr:hypothetical protein HDU96_002671 [Phlyctochytrium bullatum]
MAIGGLNPVPVASFNVRSANRRQAVLGFHDAPIPSPTDPNAPVPVRPGEQLVDRDTTQKSKKKKKRFSWIQRDSLARRLFIGKVGSRRRQRHDNNHFVDHPLVDPNEPYKPRDAHPGPPMPRPKTVFSLVPPGLRPRVFSATVDAPAPAPAPVQERRLGEKAMTKAHRCLRRDLRRGRWISEEAVAKFEAEIVGFVVQLEEAREGREMEEQRRRIGDVGKGESQQGSLDTVVGGDEPVSVLPSASPVNRSNASVATGSSLSSDDGLCLDDLEDDAIVLPSPAATPSAAKSAAIATPAGRSSISSSTSTTVSGGPTASNGWINIRLPQVAAAAATPDWVWVDATPSTAVETCLAGGAGAAEKNVSPCEAAKKDEVEEEEEEELMVCMSMVINDSSLRLLVHMMCRYYGLLSHSENDTENRRVTFIYPTADFLSSPSIEAADCTASLAALKLNSAEDLPSAKGVGSGSLLQAFERGSRERRVLPEVSFVEYVFA